MKSYKQTKYILTLIIVILIISSCTGQTPLAQESSGVLSTDQISVVKLPTYQTYPSGTYWHLVWLLDGRLMITFEKDHEEFFVFAGEEKITPFDFPIDPLCRAEIHALFSLLPDGRLGMIQTCFDRWQDDSSRVNKDASYILAYDLETGELEKLVAEESPNSWLSSWFSWNPEMTRGVQQTAGLYGTLHWISPEGISPMEVTLSDGETEWTLSDNLISEHNETMGIASDPAWSPDGETIAFFGSLDAVGWGGGRQRLVSEYVLYFMDAETNQLSEIELGERIYNPYLMYWSPNGEWLVFSAHLDSVYEPSNILFFSMKEKKLIRLKEISIEQLAWSPDGNEIAAIVCPEFNLEGNENKICEYVEVWKMDVSEIVNQSD